MRLRKRFRRPSIRPGCSDRTFHATADEELNWVLDLCEAVATQGGPEFVAQNAMSVSEAVS